jgi:serine/threonine protein kinase
MEYIDGYDLASIMSVYADKGELMPNADVLRIGDAIANALDYAHKQGVIHRDVKPANVLIADDGHVTLGDFGLALVMRDKSQGEVFGSPHYISPEQARRSSDAVPQSDLYSLGVILYEMLAGATPFNDPSPASLALQHISEAPPSPRSINPSLSPKIEDVLLKALEKKPAHRYQSGRELMDALRKALTEKPATKTDAASSMPPIPVGAPTIHRSNTSLNSFTKRRDIRTALEKTKFGGLENIPGFVEEKKKTKRRLGWLIFLVLLISALGLGLKLHPDLFASISPPLTSLLPAAPAQTEPAPVAVPLTDSPTSEPTVTQTETTAPTTSPSATTTQTPLPTAAPTETISPTSTVSPTSTIRYPAGYLMTAFYNENSFYIFNRGKASRSESGFIFERINDDGTFQDRFAGWEWEKYFMVIQSNRCMSLEIYQSKESYLRPVECENRTLSRLEPTMNSGKIFWTPNDTSHQFRILWQREEIARCEIEARTCDFYVP